MERAETGGTRQKQHLEVPTVFLHPRMSKLETQSEVSKFLGFWLTRHLLTHGEQWISVCPKAWYCALPGPNISALPASRSVSAEVVLHSGISEAAAAFFVQNSAACFASVYMDKS